jgi:hypothetical protein
MEVISAKIDKKTKEKMKKFSNINWSEVIRAAIAAKLKEEELQNRSRPFNRGELLEAAKVTDTVRSRHIQEKGWASTDEIRKWRQSRR